MPTPKLSLTGTRVILGLSGGVDSAVSAILLKEQGADIHALHMTNWEDDDGYCTAAADLQDARNICEKLGVPLHQANFTKEYRNQVFENFLREYEAGRTPNPDILCNREIKFGGFLEHAKRLGADLIATGHYARRREIDGQTALFKGADPQKDQSYFLHAVSGEALAQTIFPLGDLQKTEVRDIAREYGLEVHNKKDSTGICFIGERPFSAFLSTYLPDNPGLILTTDGQAIGQHRGLMYHTLGQRHGLGIGGRRGYNDKPWYVARKDVAENTLIVVQGNHPLRFSKALIASEVSWINTEPDEIQQGLTFRCKTKIRYRQTENPCIVSRLNDDALVVTFDNNLLDITPGQYAVFYDGDHCLGGAVIDDVIPSEEALLKAG